MYIITCQESQNNGGTTKLSGVPPTLKNRPRIPTPDVTKEVVDRENRLATLHAATLANSTAGGGGGGLTGALSVPVTSTMVTSAGHQQPSTLVVNGMHSPGYQTELPVVQVVLSPIQELADSPTSTHGSGGSSHGGGHGGTGTAALAQAVLSPALTTAGLGPVTLSGTPVLATAVSTMTLTPVTMSQPLLTSLGLSASAGNSPTHSLTLHTSLPVAEALTPPGTYCASAASHTASVTLTELTPGADDEGASVAGSQGDRSRKTSAASQAPKRGEVYV